MEKRKYKVVIAQSGKLDVKEKRNISFSNLNTGSMQRILALDTLPTRYNTIGFRYRGYDIYMKYTACFLTPLELLERKIKIRDTSNQYADVSY